MVDSEIIGLSGKLLKIKKDNRNKTYKPPGKHAGRAKLGFFNANNSDYV